MSRTSVAAVLVAIAVLGGPFAVAATRPKVDQGPPAVSSGPPPAEIPPVALVDDTGSVVVVGDPATGQQHARGTSRDGTPAWEAQLPAGLVPVGCGPCPDLWVLDTAGGGFTLIRDGAPTDQTVGRSLGLVPLTSSASQPAWTSTERYGIRLRPSPLETSSGPFVPLSSHLVGMSQVALDGAARTAIVVAPVDPIRPGERRLVLARDDDVLLDRVVPVRLGSLSDRFGSVCLAADSSAAAALLPDGDGAALVAVTPGEEPATTRLPVRMVLESPVPPGCHAWHGSFLVFAAGDDPSSDVTLAWVRDGRVTTVDLEVVSPRFVAGCGPGAVVVETDGVWLVDARGGQERIDDVVDGGCTPHETPWVLDDQGAITWMQPLAP